MFAITGVYAALLAIWFIVLSVRVIAVRRRDGVSLGSDGDAGLERRVRAQGNFSEYAPFGVVLLALLEARGGAPWLLHGIGAALLAGRLMHGIAFSWTRANMRLRVGGMVLTFAALGAAAAGLLFTAP